MHDCLGQHFRESVITVSYTTYQYSTSGAPRHHMIMTAAGDAVKQAGSSCAIV